MDVLICEDDPVTRSVLSDLVEDSGGTVLAALDSELEATRFLKQFTPDVVIVDLLLQRSSGVELVQRVRQAHPSVQVIVFTAHDALVTIDDPAVEVVVKPDFERLGRILSGASQRAGERRRPSRTPAPFRDTPDGHAFYRLVAGAQPDDVLVRVRADGDAEEVAQRLRAALRDHDVVLARTDSVVALAMGGGEDTVRAIHLRMETSYPTLAPRTTTALAGTDPVATFTDLTAT